MMERANLHATVVVIGNTGVLIEGASGAGKSTLALRLIERSRARNGYAALVADDRIWLSAHSGRLVAEVPEAIAGLIEIRGLGPVACRGWVRRAIVDRVVALVEVETVSRLPEPASRPLLGVPLPLINLAERHADEAARSIEAWVASTPDV